MINDDLGRTIILDAMIAASRGKKELKGAISSLLKQSDFQKNRAMRCDISQRVTLSIFPIRFLVHGYRGRGQASGDGVDEVQTARPEPCPVAAGAGRWHRNPGGGNPLPEPDL